MKDKYLMTSANKYYKEKSHIFSYDNKYLHGKSIYDDLFDENFVNNQVKILNKDARILEIGSYTGRISKKLEKHNLFLIKVIYINSQFIKVQTHYIIMLLNYINTCLTKYQKTNMIL